MKTNPSPFQTSSTDRIVPEILVLADDLTGALDSTVQFVGCDREVVVLLDSSIDYSAPILGIDTRSREADAEEAARKVRDAWEHHAPKRLYKKIDSALRGNIFHELEALLNCKAAEKAILAPALPKYLRSTIRGIQHIPGFDRGSSRVDLAKLFNVHNMDVELIGLQEVRKGEDYIYEKISRSPSSIQIVDSETDHDLRNITRAIIHHPHWLPVGSLGFASAFSWVLFPGHQKNSFSSKIHGNFSQQILYVTGSQHSATRSQVEHLLTHQDVIKVELNTALLNLMLKNPHLLLSDLQNRALKGLKQGLDVLILLTCESEGNLWDQQINSALEKVIETILGFGLIDTIVATGGETAAQVYAIVGINQLRVQAELYSGVVLSQPLPSINGIKWLIAKSGSFGDVDTLTSIGRMMKGHQSPPGD